jgi:hypothetical protein
VARAKSTDRAEARRRYRAAAAAADAEDLAPAAAATPASGPKASGSAPGTRPSITASFRSAIRPANVRADLIDLPRMVTRTFAIWVPALIMIVIFIVFETSGAELGNQTISSIAFNLFIFPPPLAATFLAGVLADRSSYLAGGIIGLLSGILFSIYVMTAAGTTATGTPVTDSQRVQFALYALLVSPLTGLAIGGFAGFYRRFLRSANPNSGRKQPAKSTKQAARKR